MVRFTTVAPSDALDAPTLHVEGRLVGDWVMLLEVEAERLLRDHSYLPMDLTAVTLVDVHGVDTLKKLLARGARITHCPLLIRELLEEATLI